MYIHQYFSLFAMHAQHIFELNGFMKPLPKIIRRNLYKKENVKQDVQFAIADETNKITLRGIFHKTLKPATCTKRWMKYSKIYQFDPNKWNCKENHWIVHIRYVEPSIQEYSVKTVFATNKSSRFWIVQWCKEKKNTWYIMIRYYEYLKIKWIYFFF